QKKSDNNNEIPVDGQAGDNESHLGINPATERDDEGIPLTPGLTTGGGINLDSSTRDLAHQGLPTTDNTTSRSRANEQITTVDHQQGRVPMTPTNNYYKNLTEKKYVAK
ncbi:unnamed protein product, partial [Adineta steineri]